MKRIAVFPGSFDPITLGHVDIVNRSLKLFDEVIIAIGTNATKQTMFSILQREQWIFEIFKGNEKINVMTYEKLTVDFCKKVNAQFIIRGLRNANDFEYEAAIARMNYELTPDIETVCIVCAPQFHHISSSIVRDVVRNGGDAGQFVPAGLKLEVGG